MWQEQGATCVAERENGISVVNNPNRLYKRTLISLCCQMAAIQAAYERFHGIVGGNWNGKLVVSSHWCVGNVMINELAHIYVKR
jgi:hypothetical protein